MATQLNFVFRRAKIDDIKTVRQMIQELADYEKMSDGPKLSELDLIRDSGLEGGRDYIHIYVLELLEGAEANNGTTTTVIGIALCYISYSTWLGKSYFLEDIYVRPAYRGIGAGGRIFREVAARAKEYQCKQIDFNVLAWNPARAFYERMGAVDLTEAEEWHRYRLHEEHIDKLAKKCS